MSDNRPKKYNEKMSAKDRAILTAIVIAALILGGLYKAFQLLVFGLPKNHHWWG
jgi:hypothetical protein